MRGMPITFVKEFQSDTDEMNNPIHTKLDMVVDDCLVAPITEPASAREQQAMHQQKDQVRIHLPKAFDGDISGSTFVYNYKEFRVDSDSVSFMRGNTPTRWNRYFRAEFVRNYSGEGDFLVDGFITEGADFLFVPEDSNNYYYFAQEMVS